MLPTNTNTSTRMWTPDQDHIHKRLREARLLLADYYRPTFKGRQPQGCTMVSQCGRYQLRYTMDPAETQGSKGGVRFESVDEFRVPVLFLVGRHVNPTYQHPDERPSFNDSLEATGHDWDRLTQLAAAANLNSQWLPTVVTENDSVYLAIYASTVAATAAAFAVIRPHWHNIALEGIPKMPKKMPSNWQWALGFLQNAGYLQNTTIHIQPLDIHPH